MKLIRSALPCVVLCAELLHARTVQDDWIFPPAPDRTGSVTVGDTITIAWSSGLRGYFDDYCGDCDTSDVDLWIDSSSETIFLIKAGINVGNTFSYNWEVPDSSTLDTIESDTYWVFRFIPSGQSLGENTGEISSASFYIFPAASETVYHTEQETQVNTAAETVTNTEWATRTTLVTATQVVHTFATTDSAGHSIAATTTFITLNTQAADSQPGGSANRSSSLTSGEKAGIGVGAAVGALLLIGLGFLLAPHIRRQRHHQEQQQPPTMAFAPPMMHHDETAHSTRIASTMSPNPDRSYGNMTNDDVHWHETSGGDIYTPHAAEMALYRHSPPPAELEVRR